MALNDVPLSTQTLASTQPDIRTNFQVIDTAFSVDHVDYNAAGQGKHNQVTLPEQSVAPTFTGTDNGVYSKLRNTYNEIYIHKQTFAGTDEIPFTASILSSSTPVSGAEGYTYLPSGIHHSWGSGSATGLTTITIASNLAPPTQILNVQLTPFDPSTTYKDVEIRLVDILSRTQFRVFGSVAGASASASFSFFVIGY